MPLDSHCLRTMYGHDVQNPCVVATAHTTYCMRECECMVKWGNLEHMGNLERPCKSSVNGKLQVKFSVCNVSMN